MIAVGTKRKIIRIGLVIGAIAGFGSGFAHMARHHHDGREFVARHCVDAALSTIRDPSATADATGPHHRRDRIVRQVRRMCADIARERSAGSVADSAAARV